MYSTYSFTLSNRKTIPDSLKLDVDASISFTINPSLNFKNYIQSIQKRIFDSIEPELKKEENKIEEYLESERGFKFYGMVGKYDYFIFIPKDTWNFLKEFNENGIFSAQNSDYCSNVYQMKTSWLYRINFNEENVAIEEEKSEEYNEEIKGKIEETNEEIKEIINHASGYMKRSFHIEKALALLFYDFKKNIKSMFSREWREDLCEQFLTFLQVIRKTQKETIELPSDVLEEMINSIRQTYIHITQASRLFFEIPSTNLRYTGSYNKVLKAYYGIVKRCLYIAYSIPKKKESKQSVLIPVITFEYTSKVNTHLYVQSGANDEKRLVVFHLPYDALTNIPKYMGYLCHEVYHYISPVDRALRNGIVGRICLSSYYYYFLEIVLLNYLENTGESNEVYKRNSEQIVTIFLTKNYDYIKKIASQKYEETKIQIQDEPFSNFMRKWKNIIIQNFHALDTNGNLQIEMKTFLSNFITEIIKLKEEDVIKNEEVDYERDIISKLNNLKIKDVLLLKPIINIEQDRKLLEDAVGRFGLMEHGVKEACCDLFAIQILKLEFDDYLSYIAAFLYDTGMFDLDNIGLLETVEKGRDTTSLFKRIGMIIYYFCVKNGKSIDVDLVKQRIEKVDLKITEKLDEENDLLVLKFKTLFERSYASYIGTFGIAADSIYSLLMTGIIRDETVDEDETLDQYFRDIRGTFQYYKKIISSTDKNEHSGAIFKKNLDIMQICQSQPSFEELKNHIEEKTKESIEVKIEDNPKEWCCGLYSSAYEVEVETFGEYVDAIKYLSDYLSDRKNTEANMLWYRGHASKSYQLLPSIMREAKNVSILTYEIGMMDLYQSKASAFADNTISSISTSFDWLVSMQHYGMPTHLLDWSENAFIALFFALSEGEISDELKDDAVVYILKPEAMYKARKAMIKKVSPSSLEDSWYPITNFSTSYHNTEYEDFLPIVPGKDLNRRYADWRAECARRRNEWWPLPIVCSLSNPRIRSQYGAFTVFNLMAKPDVTIGEKNHFDYLSIENMQKKFLEMFPSEKAFLCKIVISKGALHELNAVLKKTGIRAMNAYPELEKIGKDIHKQVDSYFRK